MHQHPDSIPRALVKIKAVSAQLKECGYRSFPNFVVALKEAHMKLGYSWTPELDTCRAKDVASTQRGTGIARQCMELPILKVAVISLGADPVAARQAVALGGSLHIPSSAWS